MAYRPTGQSRGSYWRSRDGDSRREKTSAASYNLPLDRDIMEGLDRKPVETLDIPVASAKAEAFSGTLMENVQYVGSYNWVETKEPTIIVPGSPPIWNNRRAPFSLSPDSGVQLVDQNGYKMQGSSSFLPAFAAVDAIGTVVDWSSLDIVTDRNALRKLMRWVTGNSSREFRVDLELAGESTVVFNRWEKRFKEVSKYETFGFKFEEETTNAAPGCSASTGHHRMITYDYFGLKMLVRFEVDACLPTTGSSLSRSSATQHPTDDLSEVINRLKVNTASPNVATSSSLTSQVRILKGGSVVPQNAIVELTTRSHNNIVNFDWAEALPQLYLSSTPHLFIGVHRRGTFSEIRKHDLNQNDLVKKRREAAKGYEKLGRALENIQGLLVQHGVNARLSLVCKDGALRVYKRTAITPSLPAALRARFDASED